jgi:hypothetical protein
MGSIYLSDNEPDGIENATHNTFAKYFDFFVNVSCDK